MIYKPGACPDTVMEYNEYSVKKGYYGNIEGSGFMKLFLEEK